MKPRICRIRPTPLNEMGFCETELNDHAFVSRKRNDQDSAPPTVTPRILAIPGRHRFVLAWSKRLGESIAFEKSRGRVWQTQAKIV
jgi:hypothetical protein